MSTCNQRIDTSDNEDLLFPQISAFVQTNFDEWPTNDQDIVRYLIDKQKFDGSWDLDSSIIKRLTGKLLTTFEQITNSPLLISAIVVVVFEIRFTSFSVMWHGVIQKARKYLLAHLHNDKHPVDALLELIRKQI